MCVLCLVHNYVRGALSANYTEATRTQIGQPLAAAAALIAFIAL
jgi:hypothetical protein